MTNGYDYWFNKHISLVKAAVITIMDNFNCKFKSGKSFNHLTYDEVVKVEGNTLEEISKLLKNASRRLKEMVEEERNMKQIQIRKNIKNLKLSTLLMK